MRIIVVCLLVLALAFVGVPTIEAGCGSCGPEKSPGKTEAQCPDGVCSTTSSEKPVESPKHIHGGSNITTAGLRALLQSKVPLTILDARSGKYDDGRRIPGAKSLNADSKVSEILKILPEKESLIITYCSNLKCPASHKLFEHLKSLGYKNLLEYPEGIAGWIEAGYEVEKPPVKQ
ncbi:MAG TPA: rhodanese-like domain-containing protein [Candidatus Ozemobacteraceae bacterium]|nr:rhodanese-like domain-containing protein [Candidatus Ozemobacteraceae bacterium]